MQSKFNCNEFSNSQCLTKTFLVFLILFVLSCSSTLKNPFFYKIEKKEASAYVLGTVHTGIQMSELPDSIIEIFNRASVYAGESPSTDLVTEKHLKKLRKKLNLKIGKRFKKNIRSGLRLDRQLKPKTWKFVYEFLKLAIDNNKFPNLIIKKSQIKLMPPLMALYLIQSIRPQFIHIEKSLAWGFNYGRLDKELSIEANIQKKTIIDLDPPNYMLENLNCLDEFAIIRLDYLTESDSRKMSDDYESLYRGYRSGSEDWINNYILKTNSKATIKCILEKRNKKWAQILKDELNGPNHLFIAVGVAHLMGENSFFDVLRKLGFKINRVSFEK